MLMSRLVFPRGVYFETAACADAATHNTTLPSAQIVDLEKTLRFGRPGFPIALTKILP